MAGDVNLNTNAATATQAQNPVTDAPGAVKEKDGRSYSVVSKKHAVRAAIAIAVIVAIIAAAILITALLPYMLPAGAAIGAGVQAAGVAVGAFAAKVVTWITAHSTIMIIASSSVLGVAAIGGVAACVAPKCKKAKDVAVTEEDAPADETVANAPTTPNAGDANAQALLNSSQVAPQQQLNASQIAAQQQNAPQGTPQQPPQQPNLGASQTQTQEQLQQEFQKFQQMRASGILSPNNNNNVVTV